MCFLSFPWSHFLRRRQDALKQPTIWMTFLECCTNCRQTKCREHACPKIIIRCAKGFFARGILGGTGFSLLRWEKGSETPSCGGTRGLRLPRSLGRSMRNEGVSDPFPHRKRESQTLFPTAKGKTPYLSENPLSENPLSATNQIRPSKRLQPWFLLEFLDSLEFSASLGLEPGGRRARLFSDFSGLACGWSTSPRAEVL